MPLKGQKLSKEHRKILSQVHLGNKYTLGRKHTELEKQHISESLKGHKVSTQTRLKMSLSSRGEKNPNWGRIFGAEVRRNMSIARKGIKLSEEHRHNISKSLLEHYSKNKRLRQQNKKNKVSKE